VRLVVHADVADNIESYFQEAGRCGRDEKKSFAVLLYNNSDVIDFDERVKRSNPPLSKLRATYQALSNYFQLAVGAGENASFSFDIAGFRKQTTCTRLKHLTACVYSNWKDIYH
jgi:ATP-dependent DNA helicase RecQ